MQIGSISGHLLYEDDAPTTKETVENAVKRGVDLGFVDLGHAYLGGAKLGGAYLGGTCLDPANIPNGDADGFEVVDPENGICRGYRTKNSPHLGGPGYELGGWYEAPWFSTADTECHPGLYVRPEKDAGDISVLFWKGCLHRAGDKYRVKRFIVEGE